MENEKEVYRVTVKKYSTIDDDCGIGGCTFNATVSDEKSYTDNDIYLVSLEELKRVLGDERARFVFNIAGFIEGDDIWLFHDEVEIVEENVNDLSVKFNIDDYKLDDLTCTSVPLSSFVNDTPQPLPATEGYVNLSKAVEMFNMATGKDLNTDEAEMLISFANIMER